MTQYKKKIEKSRIGINRPNLLIGIPSMDSNRYPSFPLLIVDDDLQMRQMISDMLNVNGITHTIGAANGAEALESLNEVADIGIVILDLTMPGMSGREALPLILEEHPNISVIIVTGDGDVSTAVECIKEGAFDYLVKPVRQNELIASIKRAIEIQELRKENLTLRQHLFSSILEYPETFSSIITRSEKMHAILLYIEAVAHTAKTVLISGETGTGKELIAQAIHTASGRTGEFVPVNVAGFDDTMFADTLFGHVKGAYTGAEKARAGLIETASGGTLFLDEIGDLSQLSQVKLLRLMETGDYLPVGSDLSKRSKARILVATNKALDLMVSSGEFRKDLYFRLRTHYIDIPPLRERKEDIPLLLDHFLSSAAEEMDKTVPRYPSELVTLLSTHNFPGNIRELKSYVDDALSNHKSGILSMDVFKKALGNGSKPQVQPEPIPVTFSDTLPTLKEMANILVDEALKRADGNQSIAAGLLGISQPALNKRLKNR
jgi:DNA-binding NtrC family response regulator